MEDQAGNFLKQLAAKLEPVLLIMANKVTFVGFRGSDRPIPSVSPLSERHNCFVAK